MSILANATILTALAGSLSACADDAGQIKQLIPSATAILRRDYDKMLSRGMKKLSDLDQPSLTAVLLTTGPKPNESKEATEEFQAVDRHALRASRIATDMFRQPGESAKGDSDAITWIHSDRITDFTCVPSGDVAKGTVSWQLLDQVKGKFDYAARRKEAVWQITEIQMAAHGVHLVRDDQGKWKQR
jgi:hypothetical protein